MALKNMNISIFISLLLICSKPSFYINGFTLLPVEIRMINIEYPPNINVYYDIDPNASHIICKFDVIYEILNPNDNPVGIPMGNCYEIPFYHVNATFLEQGLEIRYGYFAKTMPCTRAIEPGLHSNISSTITFGIYSYSKRNLPLGFYTFWYDLNYSNMYYPVDVSYAFMNVTETKVVIIIEWENHTENFTREASTPINILILPLLVISIIVNRKRKRKSKKYFI